MIVSCLQMPIVIGDYAKNAATLCQMADEAVNNKHKPDVIVLPELWDVGFFPQPLEKYATCLSKEVHLPPACDSSDIHGRKEESWKTASDPVRLLSALAAFYEINIVGGSIALKNDDGSITNTCFVFDRNGANIARYDKAHLFSPGHEDRHFKKGDSRTIFLLDGIRCGVAICYDVRFFEFIGAICRGEKDKRQNEIAGNITRSDEIKKDNLPEERLPIDMIFLPIEWPELRRSHWELLARAAAVENQVYLCGCNASGAFSNGPILCGRSCIIGPWGEELAVADHGDRAIITADCPSHALADARRRIPLARDRRPELY